MPDFAYIARDATGQRVAGMLNAQTERDVLSALAGRSLFPVEVTTAAPARSLGVRRRIKTQLVAATYAQLAALMRSGVPLLRSLQVLSKQTSHAGLKEVLSQIQAQVEDGSSLADAMARHPKAFGEMAVNMVRAGGEGGFLEDALDRVADFTEKQQELKSRTTGAVAYPAFLAVVGTIVVIVLLVFFVPKFAELFAGLRSRGELPVVTEVLLAVSNTLGSWWGVALLVALVFAALVARSWLATPAGRIARDRWKLRVPLAGGIFLNLAVSRFCRVLGTLLANGVPILKSLHISSEAAGNRVLASAIQDAAENVTAGQSLAAPLAACGHFPVTVIEMIAVAEESNTLETVLTDVSDSIDRQTWRQLDLMVRLLEPIMLLVLAGVVLFVVAALLIPVLKMSMTISS